MEDIVILKRLDFFSGLSTMELAKINSVTHRATYSPGEVIVEEGTRGGSMYLVKKGSVTVSRAGSVLASLGEGDPIGEIAFIDKGTRSATVKADEDTILIEIPGEAFEGVLEKNKDIAFKVYRAITAVLCRRLREANALLKSDEVLLIPPSH
jgi:CRP-like cAMP-binding protein